MLLDRYFLIQTEGGHVEYVAIQRAACKCHVLELTSRRVVCSSRAGNKRSQLVHYLTATCRSWCNFFTFSAINFVNSWACALCECQFLFAVRKDGLLHL